MATTEVANGGKQYVDFDEFIDLKLKKTRTSIKLTDLMTALAGVAVLCLAYLLMFVVLDHWVITGGFSMTSRWIMLGGLFVVTVAWIVWKVLLPSTKDVTGLYAARNIEAVEPGMKNGLMNLVDLRRAGRKMSPSIKAAMEKRAAVSLSKFDVDEAVDRRPLMWLSYVLLGLVVLFCTYALFSPKTISGSVWRAMFPASATAVDTTFKIDRVTVFLNGKDEPLPADISLPARSKIEVVVDLEYFDDAPEAVVLHYTTQDGKFVKVPVPMREDADEEKRYRAQLTGEYGHGILQNTSYFIVAGDAEDGGDKIESDTYQITVEHPPIVTVTSLTYRYPDYMGRRPKQQQGGNIDTWERTPVAVKAVVDRPVREAWLVLHNSENTSEAVGRKRMTIRNGTDLTVELQDELTIQTDGKYSRFYHIHCEDKEGLTDPKPLTYGITLHPDLAPKVVILDPNETELDLPSNTEVLPLLYRANDPDFKIKFLTLRSEFTRSAEKVPKLDGDVIFDGNQKIVRGKYEWQLGKYRIKQGDSMHFQIEARDNKAPAANRGFSRWVTIRFVEPASKEEVQQRLDADRKRQERRQEQEQQNENPQPNREQPKEKKTKNGKADPMQEENGDGMGKSTEQNNDGKTVNKNSKQKSSEKTAGGQGNPEKNDSPEKGNNTDDPPGMGEGSKPKEIKPDGSQDDQLLQKLNKERLEKEKAEKSKTPPEGEKPKGEQPGANGSNPSPKKQAGMEQGTDPKNKTSQNPMPMKNGENPMPEEEGMGSSKSNKNPQKKTEPVKNPMENGPGGKMGEGIGMGKKTDMPKKGKTTDPDGGMPDKVQPGMGTKKPKNPSNNNAKKTKELTEGKTKPAAGNEAGMKKKASGTETGNAKPQNNPKANPTKSKRPEDLMTDPKDKKVTKQSPGKANPNAKKQETPKSGGPKKKSDIQSETEKTAKNTPNNKMAPKSNGAKKEAIPKPKKNSGENGSGMSKKTGNPNSKKPGMAETKPKPGAAKKSNGMKSGKSNNKPGMGSGKKPGKKSSSMGSGNTPGSTPSPMGKPSGTTPGGGAGSKTSKKSAPKQGAGGGTGPRKNTGPEPNLPEPVTPKDKTEYGKKAVDLILDDLDGKMKRGETDKDWLKKHGFNSKNDVKQFIDRVRNQLKTPANNKGQQLQQDAFFRNLSEDSFQTKQGVQKGSNVRQRNVDGVGSGSDANIPPHLKQYYKFFTESVGKRPAKKR